MSLTVPFHGRFLRTALAVACALAVPAPAFPASAGQGAAAARPAPGDQRRAERLAARRGRGMRSIFDQPQVQLREAGGRTVRLAPDAILAEERFLVPSLRKALDAAVIIGAPFRIGFPAGDLLLVRAGDPARSHCLLPYPAPHDESGIAYPDVCLIDQDGDGRYERARFQPEDPDDRPRDVPIAPVALRTLQPADQPGLLSIVAEQRLRVLRVARDRAVITVESRLVPSGPSNLPTQWSVPAANPEAVLRLEDGATARLAGLQLRAARDPSGGWQVTTEGRFDDWLVLRDDNTVIDTGATVMGAQ